MSLINCRNCGKQISDKSNKCVHCGCSITKETTKVIGMNKKPASLSVTITILLFSIIVGYFMGKFLFNFGG